ncbi:MAG: hypothetical protein ABJ242_02330 [Marinomonas sp.]
MKGLIALTVGAALVAGCASGPRKPSSRALQQIDRALAKAPGKAQPSVIVKTELAFNRMVREKNLNSALQFFAAPGAKTPTKNGQSDVSELFFAQTGKTDLDNWDTKSVFMSCDGSTAVSQGRLTAGGKVGNYVIVWERQPGISTRGDVEETGYRYVYFTRALDDPQPPPKPVITPGPNDIVVEALDSVRADIADCGTEVIAPVMISSPSSPAAETEVGGRVSRDGSLQWMRLSDTRGDWRVNVYLRRKDEWDPVLTLDLPSAP